MALLDELRRLREGAPKVLGGMTPKPGDEYKRLLCEFADENMGDPESYPASRRAFEYVARVLGESLFPGSPLYPTPTSGGTEGNILGLYLARILGSRRVVYSETAHYSIEKAARILGMNSLRIPAKHGYEFDLEALDLVLEEGDVVVATLGTTETGYVDPVREVAKIAASKGAIVHVDAAYAGPIVRFLAPQKLVERLDSTVVTAAVDAHKILNTPYHAGVIYAASEGLAGEFSFEAPYIPSGYQPGLLGSRSGAPYVAAAVALEDVGGVEGLKRLAGELMESARFLYNELVERGPYGSPHEPETPVLCLTHPRHVRLAAWLRARGYVVYTCPRHGGIRLALTRPLGGEEAWSLVELLRRAAEEA